MKKCPPVCFYCLSFFFLLPNPWVKAQGVYPFSRTVIQMDTMFGQILNDPYRWLENDTSLEVKKWINDQQALTDAQFAGIDGADSLFRQMERYTTQGTWARLPVYETPQKVFFYNWTRNQLNLRLCYSFQGDTATHLMFDSWNIHPGIRYSISSQKFSPDGRALLVAFDKNGEEYPFVKVYDVENNRWLPDSIPHVYDVSLDWTADSKHFIYGYNLSEDRDDPANFDKDVYKKHTLGTAYTSDPLLLNYRIAERIEKNQRGNYQYLFIKDSQKWVYCQPNQGFEFNCSNMYRRPNSALEDTLQTWRLLYADKDSVLDFLETPGDYYFISVKGNGYRSLQRTPVNQPDFAHPTAILTEEPGWQIEKLSETKSFLLVDYSRYGFLHKTLFVHKASGKVMPLKSMARYDRYDVKPMGMYSDKCLVGLAPVNRPRLGYVLDISKDTLINDPFWAVHNQTLLAGYEDIVSELVEVPSYDGTLVPLSIMRNKNTPLDGSAVCLLYGYGAYGINDNTYNSYGPLYSLLIQRGVILANAYVRGGGAKGEAWHRSGMKAQKANTWKDFIACAEFLIRKGYTSPLRLGCTGASAGGILIGRAITERPDLFAAAAIQSGSVNQTRTSAYLNGVNNYPEFGNPDIPEEWKGLLEMDALQHVHSGVSYPAVYLSTGINDHRVAPWMPYKFTAAMQSASSSKKPVLLHTNLEGGHFGNANASSLLELFRSQFRGELFLLWQCGHPDFQKRP